MEGDEVIMETNMEHYVEKVPTGAIVIITGDYVPVKKAQPHLLVDEPVFMVSGDTTPVSDDVSVWELVEAIDFAS